MRATKVLIGSCGGLTGAYLAKWFKANTAYEIYGSDCAKDTFGSLLVDRFVSVPASSNQQFICELINLLNNNEIDYYFPTHSTETRVIAYNADILKDNCSTKFLISDAEAFADLDDKEVANQALKSIGIPVPMHYSIEALSGISFPIFSKSKVGSGSRGTIIINSEEFLLAYAKDNHNASYYEYLDGDEYTIDCVFGLGGELIALNQRKRIKTLGGAAIIAENDYSVDVLNSIELISKKWTLRGCVNFQFINDKKKGPVFTDVNLRFPSGGLPLTVASGIDVVSLMIGAMDKCIPPTFEPIINPKPNLRMYRHFEQDFV